jgi:hypothetical protein
MAFGCGSAVFYHAAIDWDAFGAMEIPWKMLYGLGLEGFGPCCAFGGMY